MLNHPLFLIGTSAFLNMSAQVLIKTGLNQVPSLPLWSWALHCAHNFFIFGGIICYGVSLVFWLLALARVDVSYGVPILSLSYVLTAFAGVVFFKEPLDGMRLGGILLIVGGIYCVSRSAAS